MDKHAGGGQSTSKSTCEVPARTLTAYLAIDQHPACPNGGRLELWPRKWFLLEQNPWRSACWSIFSLVQCHVDRRRWRSHQLTSDLKRCSLFRKCLRWSSRKAVSVPRSVIGGLGATERLAILLIKWVMTVPETVLKHKICRVVFERLCLKLH